MEIVGLLTINQKLANKNVNVKIKLSKRTGYLSVTIVL